MNGVSVVSWVLIGVCAFLALIIWLMARLISHHTKMYRRPGAPYVARVYLLGAPDMENGYNTLDNDMIMYMMRDYLVKRAELGGYRDRYYPPEDCAALLKDYLDFLEPFGDQLHEMGYKRIWYLRRYLFAQEEDGRWSLHDDSSYGQTLIRSLAEVAEVFAYHPYKETFAKEIAEAVADARQQNIQDALAYMSDDERLSWLEERLTNLRRGLKLRAELDEIDRASAEKAEGCDEDD